MPYDHCDVSNKGKLSLSASNLLSFESVLTTALQDLMLDWRLGEKWFMENLIDGDLGSK